MQLMYVTRSCEHRLGGDKCTVNDYSGAAGPRPQLLYLLPASEHTLKMYVTAHSLGLLLQNPCTVVHVVCSSKQGLRCDQEHSVGCP